MTRDEAIAIARKIGNGKPWYEFNVDLFIAFGLLKVDEEVKSCDPPKMVKWKDTYNGIIIEFKEDVDPNANYYFKRWIKVQEEKDINSLESLKHAYVSTVADALRLLERHGYTVVKLGDFTGVIMNDEHGCLKSVSQGYLREISQKST